MLTLILTGMKRRRADIRAVILAVFICSFFISTVLMAQGMIKSYIDERAMVHYGDWILASDSAEISHPYLSEKGFIKASDTVLAEDGSKTTIRIGSLDPSLVSFSRISLYEGRLPEKDDEVAADLYSLSRLGLSYDLGQQVTVYRMIKDESGADSLEPRTYTLVGTLKQFSRAWAGSGKDYPGLIVTETELAQYPEATVTWFYRLDPALRKINTDEFYDGLRSTLPKEIKTWYNRFTYGTTLWDNPAIYRTVSLLMISVSVFAITWLLSSYAGKRRRGWYRLRCMGVTRKGLNGIIILECAFATLPSAICGIIMAFFAGFIVLKCLASSLGIAGISPDLSFFPALLAAVFCTILVSILFVLLGTGDKRLSLKSRALTDLSLRRLSKRASKCRHPEKDLLGRQNTVHPVACTVKLLLTLAVSVLLILCLRKILSAVQNYLYYCGSPDYRISATVRVSRSHGSGTQTYTSYSPFYGMTDKDLDDLKEIEGVRALTALTEDNFHCYVWEGIEDSQIVQSHASRINDIPEILTESGGSATWTDSADTVRKIALLYGETFPDEEISAFEAGEAVLVILGPLVEDITLVRLPVTDESLRTGDEITLLNPFTEQSLTVKAVVVKDNSFPSAYLSDSQKLYLQSSQGVSVIGHIQLLERLKELAGTDAEILYNQLEVQFNSFSHYQATDKLLAAYAADHGYSYEDWAEFRRLGIELYVITPLLAYGLLFILILLVFLILVHSFTQIRHRAEAGMVRQALHLGLDRQRLRRLILMSELKSALVLPAGILLSLPVLYGQSFFEIGKSLRPGSTMASTLLNQATDDVRILALENVLFQTPFVKIILILCVISLIVMSLNLHTRFSEKTEIYYQ